MIYVRLRLSVTIKLSHFLIFHHILLKVLDSMKAIYEQVFEEALHNEMDSKQYQ